MRKIRESILVEGRYDVNKLKQIVDTQVIETSGFGIFHDAEKRALLKRIAETRGLIILTDSDRAGFLIRNHLRGMLPKEQVKHAYIPQIEGKEKRKAAPSKEGLLGVEGMRPEDILIALERAGATFEDGEVSCNNAGFSKAEFYEFGLSGKPDSAQLRSAVLKELNLPLEMTANAMLEAVNLIISREEFLDILARVCLVDFT
ncbi:MAG: DUF4093 domain-containing protein [Ruminococcaceae bacterium]|nr:DUF4093 domain-containing protein [Oscillospiraceae bacterium]